MVSIKRHVAAKTSRFIWLPRQTVMLHRDIKHTEKLKCPQSFGHITYGVVNQFHSAAFFFFCAKKGDPCAHSCCCPHCTFVAWIAFALPHELFVFSGCHVTFYNLLLLCLFFSPASFKSLPFWWTQHALTYKRRIWVFFFFIPLMWAPISVSSCGLPECLNFSSVCVYFQPEKSNRMQ